MIAAAIEAPIAALSDRFRRDRLLFGSLLSLAAALYLAALAEQAWTLSLALAAAGATSGIACTLAESSLVSATRDSARALSRWTAFGAAGDALAPLVVGLALATPFGHRGALMAVAALVAAHAWWVRARPLPAVPEEVEPREPLRAVLSRPRLWALLLAAAACTLLDEVVVAFAALRLNRDLGAAESITALCLSTCSLGSLLGAVTLDWLERRTSSRAVLLGTAVAAAVALLALVGAASWGAALPALFVLGAAAAPHHALLKAAAYDAAPDRPGIVNALAQLMTGVEIALPLFAGVVAERFGLGAGLCSLLIQPVCVLLAAGTLFRRPATHDGSADATGDLS